jgi:hypothetical protein
VHRKLQTFSFAGIILCAEIIRGDFVWATLDCSEFFELHKPQIGHDIIDQFAGRQQCQLPPPPLLGWT